MWFFRSLGLWPRHATARGAAVCGLLLFVGGCGFQPLYGPAGAGAPSARERLASIRIQPLPDRIGQQMHNLLRDRLNPRGQPSAPAYVLQVTLSEAREELGIRKDETATRANLTLFAAFTLRDAGANKVLLSGRSSSTNSFNILNNQFATLFSESDARARALRELSEDIRTRLGIYFSRSDARAL